MNWIEITIKDIRCMLREKIAWITMILLPLVVLTVAGFALSGLFQSTAPDLVLAYSYEGKPEQLEPLLHGLGEMDTITLVSAASKEDGLKMLEQSTATALMIIPDDFDVSNPDARYEIPFYYDISNQSTSDLLQGIVQGVVNSLDNSLSAVELIVNKLNEHGAYQEEMLPGIVEDVQTAFHNRNRIHMVSNGIGGDESNRSFYQVIPGFAVMFLLFSILGGSNKLIEERQNKTLRRILISPAKKTDVIIGKWAGMTMEGFIQALILFAAGALIFHLSLGANPLNLFLFLFVAAASAGAIGVFIASISRTLKQATGISMLLFMLMSALGGSWWPLEITPSFMQAAGHFIFNYWAISGIKKLILFNQSVFDVWMEMLVLAGVGMIFLKLSFDRFKFE